MIISDPLSIRQANAPIMAPARQDGLFGKIMRVATFQMAAAYDGWIEKWAFDWKWKQIHQVKCCSEEGTYNPQRCKESAHILKDLGGETFSVIPRDYEAVIQAVFFDPSKIKANIEKLGGKWEKIEHDGRWYFAIKSPENPDAFWDQFSSQVLKKMYWKIAPWDQSIILTAEDVKDVVEIGENNKCVYLVEVTVPWPMHRREIGKFVGLGCHVVMNNARGLVIDPLEKDSTTGLITEAACYEDVNCVLNYLQENKRISKSDVILRGNCLNAAIALKVLIQHIDEGLHAFVDNIFMTPREILEGHPLLQRFYDANLKATQSLASSPLRTQFNYIEDGFDVLGTIQKMTNNPLYDGQILITSTEGDVATPPEKVEKVFMELCSKLPPSHCQYILQKLSEIEGGEELSAHMASSIRNLKIQNIFLELFKMKTI